VEFSLPGGSYIVATDLPGYNWGDALDVEGLTNVPIEAGKVTQLSLSLARLVVGFRLGDGRALADQYVNVYQQKRDVGNHWVSDVRVWRGDTDNSGTLTVNLVPGHYIIYSDFPGYNWGNAYDGEGIANFPIFGGETTTLIYDLGKLVVGLKDSNGNALTDEYVNVYMQDQDLNGNPILGDRVHRRDTDNAGIVSFNLTEGNYALSIDDATTYDIPIESGKITQWDGESYSVVSP
jgi:hypothetical protein